MGKREDRAEGRRLDEFERQWRDSFAHPGDYWAGEGPQVDDPDGGYEPDGAPYPLAWPSDKRVEMTWYAQHHNIRIPYEPDLPDEGASAWDAAWESMQRHLGMERTRRTAARAAAANPTGTLPEEPAYVDPGEPRHPREDFGEW